MTRARYRAFKCRQGVHREVCSWCKDCGVHVRGQYIAFKPAQRSVNKPQLFRVTEESIARAGIGLRFTRDYILHVD